jgi:hypothetical protein
MGIALFYDTVFFVFFCAARDGGFTVFLRGDLGKAGFWMWCFAGEFVVGCMVFVD